MARRRIGRGPGRRRRKPVPAEAEPSSAGVAAASLPRLAGRDGGHRPAGERGSVEHPVARGPRHRRRPAADHGRRQRAYVARDRRRHARRRRAPVARTGLVPAGLRPRRAGRPAGAAPPGLHSLSAARRRLPRPLHLRPRHLAPDQRRRRHHRAAGGRLRRVGHRRADHGRRRGADGQPGHEAGTGLPGLFSADAAARPVVRASLSGRLPPRA